MGKRILVQRRGRGSPTFRAKTHRRRGAVKYPPLALMNKRGYLTADIEDLMHDPGRGSPVAKLRLEGGETYLALVPEGSAVGQQLRIGPKAGIRAGYILPLAKIPEGTPVFNIESQPGDGGKFVRSSGTYATIVTHTRGKTSIRLPSGKMRSSPPQKDLEWSDSGVEGAFRFINRLYRLYSSHKELFSGQIGRINSYEKQALAKEECGELEKEILYVINKTVKKVSDDIEVRFHLNTAISAVMEMVNYFYQIPTEKLKEDTSSLLAYLYGLKTIVLLLSPFVPHICEELWHGIGHDHFIFHELWPEYNEKFTKQDMITLVIQVNGKLRERLEVQRDTDNETLKKIALDNEKIKKYTQGKKVLKVIVIPNKLLNIVVK